MKKKQPAKGKTAFSPTSLTPGTIMAYLNATHRPRALDDILRDLRIPRSEKKRLATLLQVMSRSADAAEQRPGGTYGVPPGSGEAAVLPEPSDAPLLLQLPGGTYVPLKNLDTLTGTARLQLSGAAFVTPENGKGDIFITPANLGETWQGDRVSVVLFPGKRGPHREGKILEILEKNNKEMTARITSRLDGYSALAEPLAAGPVSAASIITDISGLPGYPANGSLVRIRLEARHAPGFWRAVALGLMGNEDAVPAQEEIAKANHGIPVSFPGSVLAEAAALPSLPEMDSPTLQGRKDLTAIPFVTIDGEKARDFDDAIHVDHHGCSGYRLLVAIADVAHYVRPGSTLDREAAQRGNSCYFPLSVEPMLPEALSNGLCSLTPGEPRLAMVADMLFSQDGRPGSARFYPALIKSSARLTYTQVHYGLIEEQPDAARTLGSALPMLRTALELAHSLARARDERGSLDFELPEPEYVFSPTGALTAVVPAKASFANRLIEEFMVAANEATARFLADRGYPLLYRVHPEPDPDKVRGFFNVLVSSGLSRILGRLLPAPSFRRATRLTPAQLRTLLAAVRGMPQEYVISRLALRSMMQASYSPELAPHFGLASECYCHFTSPIRRYADLVVHRALKAAISAPDACPIADKRRLLAIAGHLRTTERMAMDAEREIQRRLTILLMRDSAGREYKGIISGLTDFGIFVELPENMAEGMIRLGSLTDDYYSFNPDRQELRGQRGGKAYTLGQEILVRVEEVNLSRLEITLAPADNPARRLAPPRNNFRERAMMAMPDIGSPKSSKAFHKKKQARSKTR